MIPGCVVDIELFKKYCFEECSSIYEAAAKCVKLDGADHFVIEECHCLFDFLIDINNKKCVLYYNKGMNAEYLKYIYKLPPDVLYHLESILSNTDLAIKIQDDEGCLDQETVDKLKSTELKHKIIYLDLVTSRRIKNRRIISSKEDLENVYNLNFDLINEINSSLGINISFRNVCQQMGEIRNDKRNQYHN